jgi:hypothetical protein
LPVPYIFKACIYKLGRLIAFGGVILNVCSIIVFAVKVVLDSLQQLRSNYIQEVIKYIDSLIANEFKKIRPIT